MCTPPSALQSRRPSSMSHSSIGVTCPASSSNACSVYDHDAAARQLILAQHGLTEVTQADRQHDLELGDLMMEVFNRHFEVPTLPADVDVFALALELSDRVYARSVHQHGQITPRMAEEGMRVFDAYVGLYLPAYLPKR